MSYTFRYRGYVYDTATGLYYLQSRYYDPQCGRFVNPDDVSYLGASGTVLGWNLFTYCENDPVNYSDPNGDSKWGIVESRLRISDGNNRFFGGKQRWWGDETFSIFGRLKRKVGCAPVAASNLMLYLARSYQSLKKLYPYKSYTKTYFKKLMDDMWNYVYPGLTGVWWLSSYVNGVVKYAKSKGVNLYPYWSNKSPTYKNAVQYIKDGLSRGCPVTLIVHANSNLKVNGTSFQNHWMIITALNEDKYGNVTVDVSSWGEKYTLSFNTIYNSSYWRIMYFKW